MSSTDSSGQDGLRRAVEALVAHDTANRSKCGEMGDCPCSMKDCYECGYWHDCVHSPYVALRKILAEHPATPSEEQPASGRGITMPAHHLVDADLGFTCTNCGGHTSLTAPCIPARTYPPTPTPTEETAEEAHHYEQGSDEGNAYSRGWHNGYDSGWDAHKRSQTAEVTGEDRSRLAVVLAGHRCVVSGDVDGWHVICHCGHQARGVDTTAHIADAVLASDWLRAHDAALTANAKAEAEHLAERKETYHEQWMLAEAEVGTLQAEVDDLRARLAKVEALLDSLRNAHACGSGTYSDVGWHAAVGRLLLALANPDAAGEEP